MSLSKTELKNAFLAVFKDIQKGKSAERGAEQLADVIDTYVRTAVVNATIPAGTYTVSAEIAPGKVIVAATGGVINATPIAVDVTLNASPNSITGDPDGGPDDAGGLS
jgi:hypothetical protein